MEVYRSGKVTIPSGSRQIPNVSVPSGLKRIRATLSTDDWPASSADTVQFEVFMSTDAGGTWAFLWGCDAVMRKTVKNPAAASFEFLLDKELPKDALLTLRSNASAPFRSSFVIEVE